jgi:hypothetical protein
MQAGSFMNGAQGVTTKTPRRVFTRLLCFATLLAFALVAQRPDAHAGVVLITPEEALLPTPKDVFASRAITRGPRIDLADFDAGQVRSPLRLQLKFKGFGGATINLQSFRMTYMKSPNVDLTPRVKPFAKPTGIDISEAEVPPGEHLVRVEIHDSEGRQTSTVFLLSVAP